MSTRLLLRHDQVYEWESLEPAPTLDQGEIALVALPGRLQAHLGTENGQEFGSSVYLAAGSATTEPLVYRSSDAASDGSLVVYEGGVWQPDGTPIVWNVANGTGAVKYVASTDAWSTDPSVTIITDADGGLFTGSFTAPAFSSGYDPTIGEP